jgi:hypothetical protein
MDEFESGASGLSGCDVDERIGPMACVLARRNRIWSSARRPCWIACFLALASRPLLQKCFKPQSQYPIVFPVPPLFIGVGVLWRVPGSASHCTAIREHPVPCQVAQAEPDVWTILFCARCDRYTRLKGRTWIGRAGVGPAIFGIGKGLPPCDPMGSSQLRGTSERVQIRWPPWRVGRLPRSGPQTSHLLRSCDGARVLTSALPLA